MQDKRLDINKDLISKLKNHLKIYTDDALAKKLNVSPSAVAQWYKRGVPQRFMIEYNQIISGVRSNAVGVQEQVVVENQPIHITKGEEPVDASYIIDLQKDKIESQKKEIARLSTIVNQQKQTKNKPAFHFKTKSNYDSKTNTFAIGEVTGDTSMTGYTTEYLSNLKAEEWFAMYHPESANQLVASVPTEIPDHTHNIFKNILWKAKNGKYIVYNVESYFDKEEGVVRSYYYWVNGDIEGQS